jgi:hypothetical protein
MMFPYAWPAFVPTVARILSDGKPHTHEELLPRVAQAHALTPDECRWTMANRQNIFVNRLANVLGQLVKRRAASKSKNEDGSTVYQITDHGLEVLRRRGEEVKINDFLSCAVMLPRDKSRFSHTT